MAYTINRTDGTAIATVADGQIDQATTDITLVGKNFSGYGEYINENLVKMLENFAGDAQPNAPLVGQLWFDITENRIKVYSGNEWKSVGTSALASERPLDISSGDFWFNIITRQLYFYDGTADYLIGPDYKITQGISGVLVEEIEDSNGTLRTISTVYVGGDRVGFYSKQEFSPRIPIPNFDQSAVKVGYNPIRQTHKFLGIASNAEALGGLSADIFAKKNQSNVFTEVLTVQNAGGIRFGEATNGQLGSEGGGDVFLLNATNNQKVSIRGRKNGANVNFIVATPNDALESNKDTVKILDDYPNSLTVVGGDLEVKGNFVVTGSVLEVQSTNVQVEDKLIELAVPSTGSPTDIFADGGGIALKGDTDHTIVWDNATDTWNFSENINIPALKGFQIAGANVLYDTGAGIELAAAVNSAPGLTSFGNQIELTADNITLNDNIIANNGVTAPYSNGDPAHPTNLEIHPRGNLVLVGTPSPKITGLATTNETNIVQTSESYDNLSATERSEATTKTYVTNYVRTRSIPFNMNITGYYPNENDPMTANEIATELLRMCPPAEYEAGTKIRISTFRQILANIDAVTPTLTTTVLYDVEGSETPSGPTGTYGVIREVDANGISAKAPPRIFTIRGVTTYELNSGKTAWVVSPGGALVEDQTNPTDPLTGLVNFIRP
jgi:hypothetical protein